VTCAQPVPVMDYTFWAFVVVILVLAALFLFVSADEPEAPFNGVDVPRHFFGCGHVPYGKREFDSDGSSYTTTVFWAVLGIPLVPLYSVRYLEGGELAGQKLEPQPMQLVRLSRIQVVCVWVFYLLLFAPPIFIWKRAVRLRVEDGAHLLGPLMLILPCVLAVVLRVRARRRVDPTYSFWINGPP
jgi:hypothetical protein